MLHRKLVLRTSIALSMYAVVLFLYLMTIPSYSASPCVINSHCKNRLVRVNGDLVMRIICDNSSDWSSPVDETGADLAFDRCVDLSHRDHRPVFQQPKRSRAIVSR